VQTIAFVGMAGSLVPWKPLRSIVAELLPRGLVLIFRSAIGTGDSTTLVGIDGSKLSRGFLQRLGMDGWKSGARQTGVWISLVIPRNPGSEFDCLSSKSCAVAVIPGGLKSERVFSFTWESLESEKLSARRCILGEIGGVVIAAVLSRAQDMVLEESSVGGT
jgi:hypothetical protein